MREYTAPIYSLENDEVVSHLIFQARNFDEADRKVDQWNMQHLGEGYSADSTSATWKPVEMPELGDIHLS